jgi:hypothetical protein
MPGTLTITLLKADMTIVPDPMPETIAAGDITYTLVSDNVTNSVYTSSSFSDITSGRLSEYFVAAGFGTNPLQGIVEIYGTGTFEMTGQYYLGSNGGVNNLTLLNFSNVTMTSIPYGMFWEGCRALTSVLWPSGLTTINAQAFNECNSWLNIEIPNTVTSINPQNEASNGTPFYTTSAAISSDLIYTINSNVTTINGINSNIGIYTSPGSVTLRTNSMSSAAALYFAANYPTATIDIIPVITSVSPTSGNKDGGTPVTITGTSFTGTTSVTFGGVLATSVIVVSDTEITCVAPAGVAGPVNVVVTTLNGPSTGGTGAFTNNIVCFKEGSKILTNKGYVAVQDLRNGDLIKTVSSGFKKIEHIGFSKMYNNANETRSKDKLYRCSTSEYPELTEDLVVTGCHSILVKSFKDSEQMEKTQEVLGKIYITEKYYRLPACVDERTKIFEEEGVHTIWHFSLEHSDYYMNYGVYANGLLVETTSNRMMVELSGMTLV